VKKNICHVSTRRKKPPVSVRQKIWIWIPNKYTVTSKQIRFRQTRNISLKYLVFINSLKTALHTVEWMKWWNQTLVKLFTFGEQEYKGSQSTICVFAKIIEVVQDQELPGG